MSRRPALLADPGRRPIILNILFTMLLSGCSFVRIQNASDAPATVSIVVPDSGSAYTRIIRPGNVVDVFSSHGGRYTATVIPSETYISTLTSMQHVISQRLFQEAATLTSDEVGHLVQNLNEIDQLLEETELPGASCAGSLPDFDTAVVIVIFDTTENAYAISCSSGT